MEVASKGKGQKLEIQFAIPRVIGIPKSKRITLGDPGYPEGIPNVEGIPT